MYVLAFEIILYEYVAILLYCPDTIVLLITLSYISEINQLRKRNQDRTANTASSSWQRIINVLTILQ